MEKILNSLKALLVIAAFLPFYACQNQDDRDIKPSDVATEMTVEEADRISREYANSSAQGRVVGGEDTYAFSATLTAGALQGQTIEGTLILNKSDDTSPTIPFTGRLVKADLTSIPVRGTFTETIISTQVSQTEKLTRFFLFFTVNDVDLVSSGVVTSGGSLEGDFLSPDGGSLLAKILTGDSNAPQSIVDIILNDARFTTLVQALQAADLVETLAGPGQFTLFAPTNEAFAKLESLPEGEALKEVLLYHIHPGKISSVDLAQFRTLNGTLAKKPITISTTRDGFILNGVVKIIQTDIVSAKGIIHVIDAVLIPPPAVPTNTIVDVVSQDPRFTTLVEKVKEANLVGVLSNAQVTVFAPTNEAFAVLGDVLPGNGSLRSLLINHLVTGKLTAEDLSKLTEISSITGSKITIEVNAQGEIILNGVVKVIQEDIVADNGIIHVIDAVLLPAAETARQ